MNTELRGRTFAVLFAQMAALWLTAFNAQGATTGVTSMGFEATELKDLGITIGYEATTDPLLKGQAGFAVAPSSDLFFKAPFGDLEGFSHGVLRHEGGPTLSFSGSTFALRGFELRVAANPLDLELFDASGRRWFLFEASQPELKDGYLNLRNTDVNIAPELAKLLGRPAFAGSYFGHAELRIPHRPEARAPGPAGAADPCADAFNADRDDDNDGLTDETENGDVLLDHFDPDSDGDGIIDGIDRDPTSQTNNACLRMVPDATLRFSISDSTTCAATVSIDTVLPAWVTNTGDLLMIAPVVELGPDFYVDDEGKLSVISRDPTAEMTGP